MAGVNKQQTVDTTSREQGTAATTMTTTTTGAAVCARVLQTRGFVATVRHEQSKRVELGTFGSTEHEAQNRYTRVENKKGVKVEHRRKGK